MPNLKETYNRIAKDWYNDHKKDDWWVEGTNDFTSRLKTGDTVLDVGCGAGVKSKYLHDKGLTIIGIDFSEGLIKIAEKEVPEVEFKVIDMRDVTKLDRRFDGVFAQASLLHIPKNEVADVVKQLASVLVPKGLLYIAVKGLRPGGKEEEVIKEDDYGYAYERFFSFYTMDELVGYLAGSGLDVVYKNSKIVGKTDWLQIIGQKK